MKWKQAGKQATINNNELYEKKNIVDCIAP